MKISGEGAIARFVPLVAVLVSAREFFANPFIWFFLFIMKGVEILSQASYNSCYGYRTSFAQTRSWGASASCSPSDWLKSAKGR